jgi:hypothetical protein
MAQTAFPIFLDLRGRTCLAIGCVKDADRKAPIFAV